MMTTLSSREFNQDVSLAKRAARAAPVVITDRGKPSHVLLSYEQYQRLTAEKRSLLDVLAMPGLAEVEFDPAPARIVGKEADF